MDRRPLVVGVGSVMSNVVIRNRAYHAVSIYKEKPEGALTCAFSWQHSTHNSKPQA
jgi:hypothetical protein